MMTKGLVKLENFQHSRHKFKYDRLYVRKRSFILDVRLILLSFWITARGRWEHRGEKI